MGKNLQYAQKRVEDVKIEAINYAMWHINTCFIQKYQ